MLVKRTLSGVVNIMASNIRNLNVWPIKIYPRYQFKTREDWEIVL